MPKIKLPKAPSIEIRPSAKVLLKESQNATKAQPTSIMVALRGTKLVKSPVELNNGSKRAVKAKTAKAKLVLGVV